MKRSGETKDRTRLAFPMMVSSNVRRPFTGCRSLRTDAVRGKEIRYRLRELSNHAGAVARDARSHRVRPRTSVAGPGTDDGGHPVRHRRAREVLWCREGYRASAR